MEQHTGMSLCAHFICVYSGVFSFLFSQVPLLKSVCVCVCVCVCVRVRACVRACVCAFQHAALLNVFTLTNCFCQLDTEKNKRMRYSQRKRKDECRESVRERERESE